MSTLTTKRVIGPEHDGQRMSLADFEFADGREGYLYELSRGVVTVIDVPKHRHLAQVNVIRRQLTKYDLDHPGLIDTIASGHECKIPVEGLASERHPDLAIYKTAPPEDVGDAELWAVWIPNLVIEVVSPSSRKRDYEEKPDEYLQFGIQEYWIIDVDKQLMTVLRRSRGKWVEKKVKPPARHATHLLPGFEFDVAAVFAAAKGS